MDYINLLKRRRVALARITFIPFFAYLFFYERVEIATPYDLKGWLGLAFVLLGVLVRLLSAGFLSKNKSLASTGLYALTRNPLYFGSFLVLLGINVIIWHWMFAAVTVALFLITYVPTILGEEKHLESTFPESWHVFKEQTPRFFPAFWRLRGYREITWSFKQWKRNREYNALISLMVLVLCWIWYTA